MSETEIPDIVIRRLPLYARELGLLAGEGRDFISSQELGQRLGVTPAQIRKDLSYFGRFGKRGRGYEVVGLRERLRTILGLNGRVKEMVLVGVGRLGRAVLGYAGFRRGGFEVVRVFDSDPNQIGRMIDNHHVADVATLPQYLQSSRVAMGIVAVPAEAAPSVIEMLVSGGVRAILSYAPITTSVPSGVHLRQIDPVMELESMAYYLEAPFDGYVEDPQ
ncbi:MAG: redox-sensing transcriptional repressor Rex [Chloroflexi bacterium]|nr:redox-sensing transcriptional repressor Rex [Chloroflexota bacterium]MYB23140.1 redox-sensing transcriptional repressor Rex [Chloroflexota bacterium]MYD16409.1 redox-sensing transcriptional repressor Rex [Chloroflexota bacterium]MYF80994.1 redox-sensing transcriptional repressor Rex [Chloroflexota bacterium]MYI05151.1 redox-sensing transcriptional repressor Rex [Chloroflexota bacterium]